MTILKSIAVAFSIYSKIPMPRFEWKEEELRYHLIFFPWVGAVIGAVVVLWYMLVNRFGIGYQAYAYIGTAIPLLLTGGFHVDGYMDTMDALKSYKTKEEKLKILSDPHIGAFSVIMLMVAGLIYVGSFSSISGLWIIAFSFSFVISRILSGLAVVIFPKAKDTGMLSDFSSAAGGKAKKIVIAFLILELFVCANVMVIIDVKSTIAMGVVAAIMFAYYRWKSEKEFGGITGDTAGFFVTVCEVVLCVTVMVVQGISGW